MKRNQIESRVRQMFGRRLVETPSGKLYVCVCGFDGGPDEVVALVGACRGTTKFSDVFAVAKRLRATGVPVIAESPLFKQHRLA